MGLMLDLGLNSSDLNLDPTHVDRLTDLDLLKTHWISFH